MHNDHWQNLKWLWIAVLLIIVDIVTKQWVLAALFPYERVAVLPFFNLTLVFNAGAAFSFLHDAAGWQRWFLASVAIIASAVILIALWRMEKKDILKIVAMMSILAGALGNLLDRLLYGHVIDFLDFHFWGWHFPAFNLADAAITCGAILWFYVVWREERK